MLAEDNHIIELFFNRDERAIKETSDKYGVYLKKVAENILNQTEEAEECVNDTYFYAWNAIPPARPEKLPAYLARITRNLAIDRYRQKHTVKNGSGQVALCLDELSECIGNKETVIEDKIVLSDALNVFLRGLNKKQRDIFCLRYYYFMDIEEVAKRVNSSKASVKMSLHRIRKNLRIFLESEGITL